MEETAADARLEDVVRSFDDVARAFESELKEGRLSDADEKVKECKVLMEEFDQVKQSLTKEFAKYDDLRQVMREEMGQFLCYRDMNMRLVVRDELKRSRSEGDVPEKDPYKRNWLFEPWKHHKGMPVNLNEGSQREDYLSVIESLERENRLLRREYQTLYYMLNPERLKLIVENFRVVDEVTAGYS